MPLLTATSTLLQGPGAAATAVTDLEGAQAEAARSSSASAATRGMLATDASADVENQLNMLSSISPSKVKVSRSGPMTTGPDLSGGTQVGGYVWSITFDSASWRDPTVVHADDGSMAGNWVGEATTWTDTWATGVSKEWDPNCGDMPPISCVDSGMGHDVVGRAFPADACSVAEYVKGTEPLGGSFRVTLDTTGHDIINMRGSYTSDPIRHNAQAGVLESGGDGTSVEEILEKMPNVGDVLVTRSPVNEGANNGGHTRTVTFLRDAGASGEGRFGDCEQRDTVEDRCNSPGDVPKFGGFDGQLRATAAPGAAARPSHCQKVTLLDVADKWTAPPGRDEVQSFAVRGPESPAGARSPSSYHAAKAWTDRDDFARASYRIGFAGEFFEDCLPYDATDAQVRHALARIGKASARAFVRRALANVSVSRHFSETEAPNAWQYRVSFRGAGDSGRPSPRTACSSTTRPRAPRERRPVPALPEGRLQPLRDGPAERDGADGGRRPHEPEQLHLLGVRRRRRDARQPDALPRRRRRPEGVPLGPGRRPPRREPAPVERAGEGAGSVKQWLETTSLGRRVVNVSREVYGRHGVVEWRVTFVYNHEQVPPGSGVHRGPERDAGPGHERRRVRADGLGDDQGQRGHVRRLRDRLRGAVRRAQRRVQRVRQAVERKLEEMLTVGGVAVERLPYPSAASGGCDVAVAPEGERGGLEWRVKFTKNPGAYRGFTFPPGAGNLDSITVDGHGLQGNVPQVVNTVLRSGSTPFAGAFALGVRGAWSEPMEWQEAHDEMEYVLEQMDTVGELRVARSDVALQRVEGVWATVDRDGATASLRYDGTFGAGGTLETVLADALNVSTVYHSAAHWGGFAARGAAADGATRLDSLLAYKEDSPPWARPRRRWCSDRRPRARSSATTAARLWGDPLRRRGAAPLRGRGRDAGPRQRVAGPLPAAHDVLGPRRGPRLPSSARLRRTASGGAERLRRAERRRRGVAVGPRRARRRVPLLDLLRDGLLGRRRRRRAAARAHLVDVQPPLARGLQAGPQGLGQQAAARVELHGPRHRRPDGRPGGVTERQEIALALDGARCPARTSAWRYGRATTPCLDWGADGALSRPR